MTSRSRKKPPTTAPRLRPTEVKRTYDNRRAMVVGLLAIGMLGSTVWAAETRRPEWTPTRTRVAKKAAPRASQAPARVRTPEDPQPATRSTVPRAQDTWQRAGSLRNTSAHLAWRTPPTAASPATAPARTRPQDRPQGQAEAAQLSVTNVPPLLQLPTRIRQPESSTFIRLVQGLEDLELPFPEAKDAPDLLEDDLKLNGAVAPTPGGTRQETKRTPSKRFDFRDQSPRLPSIPVPAPSAQGLPQRRWLGPSRGPRPTRTPAKDAAGESAPPVTKHVQGTPPSRFEVPPPDDAEPAAEPSEDLFVPLTDDPTTDATDTPSPFLDPSGNEAPVVGEPPVVEEAPRAFRPAPSAPQDQLPGLPQDPGAPSELPTPPSAEEFFGPRNDAGTPGELAATNDQDCEAGAKACLADRALLRRRERTTDISLDITPSIAPKEYDMAKVEELREKKLANAPSRTWTSIRGEVLTDGTLEDYRGGRVYVRTLNGTLRSFAPHELSNEDWCFVTSWWELPNECRFEDEIYAVRDFRLTTFTWTAPSTCHRPLYFEEVQLERYGHSAGPIVQPLVSGAHFFGNIALLPYHMGLNPPNECVYTLGHYRPGSCAPWLVHGFPLTTRGIKWQGLALGAAITLLP